MEVLYRILGVRLEIICENERMYVIAVIGDLLSIVPVVNVVSGFATGLALAIVGAHTGVSIYSSRGIGKTLLTILVEMIPGLSIIPAWTIRVYLAKKEAREAGEAA